ncbi:MAG: helix-turn-helix domain-containing protein [Candidatus Omnitrophota bacterium]|nr:helix-turn-helix domain-containing protein [Candidatus Omnitrophota bacterium]
MEIKENEIYTPKETQGLLKVSASTMTRLIKSGLIRTAKVGKQYRIMGKEILRMLSPELEDTVGMLYNKGRNWAHENPRPEKAPESTAKKLSGGNSNELER